MSNVRPSDFTRRRGTKGSRSMIARTAFLSIVLLQLLQTFDVSQGDNVVTFGPGIGDNHDGVLQHVSLVCCRDIDRFAAYQMQPQWSKRMSVQFGSHVLAGHPFFLPTF